MNYLVAYRKPDTEVVVKRSDSEVEESEEEYYGDKMDYFYPLPARDVFGMQHGELSKEATKGQHVHSHNLCYISKEDHYHLSNGDAVSLMMNECHYYPKNLFLHEYEHMHWKRNHDDLMRLLTPFFGMLESLSLQFRWGKDIDSYVRQHGEDSREALELVLSCCFSSPVLSSIASLDPVGQETASKALFSTLAAKPCPTLRKLDFVNWINYSGVLEALANVIASHTQLVELHIDLCDDQQLTASFYSYCTLL